MVLTRIGGQTFCWNTWKKMDSGRCGNWKLFFYCVYNDCYRGAKSSLVVMMEGTSLGGNLNKLSDSSWPGYNLLSCLGPLWHKGSM